MIHFFLEHIPFYKNNLFKALNDPTRRQILDLLKEKDLSAGEIAEAFDISKPSISHHLDLLKNAGLVTSENCWLAPSVNTSTGCPEIVNRCLKLSTKLSRKCNSEFVSPEIFVILGNPAILT